MTFVRFFPVPSMHKVRPALFSVVAAALLLSPYTGAAAQITDIVDTRVKSVERGMFLSWTVKALGIDTRDEECTLSYPRVPRAMRGTLCAAQRAGALATLGDDLLLARPLTRGEALVIVTAFTAVRASADISAYRDVRGEEMSRAVRNAVANRWMNPLQSGYFGVTRTLGGTEALALLQAVTGQTSGRTTVRIQVNDTPVTTSTSGQQSQPFPKGDLLQSVWQLIQRDYLRTGGLDAAEAGYKAIEGLVQGLGDPYSTFFRPVDASQFQTQIQGELTGIGAHVEEKSGVITVVAPLPNSPAQKAGLKPGDEIIKADGTSLTGLGLTKAVSYIRGEKGTSVVLTVRRDGRELTITVTRDTITIPEVEVTWEGSIAVVKVVQFGETTNREIRSVFRRIMDEGDPRGIVLDLRNNPGGLLNASNVLASVFLPKGSIVAQVKGRERGTEEKTWDDPVVPESVKLSVLVNGGSASASEIVAGALQDYKRAVLVGTQTFGKGTVQELLSFRTGEALKLTVAEWLTPFGRTIEGTGLTPDLLVEDEERQMSRALNEVR